MKFSYNLAEIIVMLLGVGLIGFITGVTTYDKYIQKTNNETYKKEKEKK